MESRTQAGEAPAKDRQERLLREANEAIKTLKHGRVTVEVVGGKIRQVETTRRRYADE